MTLIHTPGVIPVSPQAKTGTPGTNFVRWSTAATSHTIFHDPALGVPVFRCAETGMTAVGVGA